MRERSTRSQRRGRTTEQGLRRVGIVCVVLGLGGLATAGGSGDVFLPGGPGGGLGPPNQPNQPLPKDFTTLPPVRTPLSNPITEEKRVLGKMLFWEEQMSSDDTVACGTCHLPEIGGADPRLVRTAGKDGNLNTKDDVFGSPGVVRQLSDGMYAASEEFGFAPQVTGRVAPTVIGSHFARELFADGRAGPEFRDPVTDAIVHRDDAGLETQALAPFVSAIEMAHEDRNWTQITEKLAATTPMRLATDLPKDIAEALVGEPSYPDLFAAAFGDAAITAPRIADAIATYERTLIADQTPFDQFLRGDFNAMTQDEQTGAYLMGVFGCTTCHAPPLFTDNSFRNIGVRPADQDLGRERVTGDVRDRGKLRVPTLRNVGLKNRLMHDGKFENLTQVLHFYGRDQGFQQFTENQDPFMQFIDVPPVYQRFIVDFLRDGLTDPRVENAEFPFDRPTLFSELQPANPAAITPGRIGSTGRAPTMVANVPPNTVNETFKLGLGDALPGSRAWIAWSHGPPNGGELSTSNLLGPFDLPDSGDLREGSVTVFAPRLIGYARTGEEVWFQWRVDDPLASGGVALSPVVHMTAFETAGEEVLPGERPLQVVELPSDTLHVESASLLIDWRARRRGDARDRMTLTGVADVDGVASPEGSTVSMSVGGVQLLDNAVLDAEGRVNVNRFAGSSARFRVDPETGKYRLNVSRADLDGILGDVIFEGVDGVQPTTMTVDLEIAGEQFTAEPQTGTYTANVRNRSGKTKANIRFSNSTALSGVFQVTDVEMETRGSARRGTEHSVLCMRAAVATPNSSPFELDGALTLEVGDEAPMVVPVSSMKMNEAGTIARYRVHSNAVPGLKRLVCNAKTGKMVLEMEVPAGFDPMGTEIAVTMEGKHVAYRCSGELKSAR